MGSVIVGSCAIASGSTTASRVKRRRTLSVVLPDTPGSVIGAVASRVASPVGGPPADAGPSGGIEEVTGEANAGATSPNTGQARMASGRTRSRRPLPCREPGRSRATPSGCGCRSPMPGAQAIRLPRRCSPRGCFGGRSPRDRSLAILGDPELQARDARRECADARTRELDDGRGARDEALRVGSLPAFASETGVPGGPAQRPGGFLRAADELHLVGAGPRRGTVRGGGSRRDGRRREDGCEDAANLMWAG